MQGLQIKRYINRDIYDIRTLYTIIISIHKTHKKHVNLIMHTQACVFPLICLSLMICRGGLSVTSYSVANLPETGGKVRLRRPCPSSLFPLLFPFTFPLFFPFLLSVFLFYFHLCPYASLLHLFSTLQPYEHVHLPSLPTFSSSFSLILASSTSLSSRLLSSLTSP